MDYTLINKWLKENLDNERYHHSLGTAQKSKELAKGFDIDEEKAYLAGLLHDCAKCFSKEKMYNMIKDNNIPTEEDELLNFKTLHAPVGAFYAMSMFGIYDETILSAIRWHTLGKLNMNDFEKLIFISDKIEPNTRPKELIVKIEPKLKENNGLDIAMLECFKLTIKSLVDRNLIICKSTIDIYNELIEKYG